MKPNFALSLTLEGIRLLHRDGAGEWTPVGSVRLDSADLAADLARLRQAALAIEPGGLAVKLVLPNDQIRYLALDTTRATESDVLAALQGATPYPVADLVHDHVKGGGRTYIAAVARETLAEAEAFAANHGFRPIAFAGVPEPFTYVGEAFFGPTALADTLLPEGARVTREDRPIPWAVHRGRSATLPPRPVPPAMPPAVPEAAKVATAPTPPETAADGGNATPEAPVDVAPAEIAVDSVVASQADETPPAMAEEEPPAVAAIMPDPVEAPPDAVAPVETAAPAPLEHQPEAPVAMGDLASLGVPRAVPESPLAEVPQPPPAETAPAPAPVAEVDPPAEVTEPPVPVFAARRRPPKAPAKAVVEPAAEPVLPPEPVFTSRARAAKAPPKVASPPPVAAAEPVFARRLPPPVSGVAPAPLSGRLPPPPPGPAASPMPPGPATGAMARPAPMAVRPALSVALPPREQQFARPNGAVRVTIPPPPPPLATDPVEVPAATAEAPLAPAPAPAPIPTITLRGASSDLIDVPGGAPAPGGPLDRLRPAGRAAASDGMPFGIGRAAPISPSSNRPRLIAALVLGLVVVLGLAALWSSGAASRLAGLFGAEEAPPPEPAETTDIAAVEEPAPAQTEDAPQVATETDLAAVTDPAPAEAAPVPETATDTTDLALAAAPPLPAPAEPEPGLPEVAPSTEPGGLERAEIAAIAQPGSAISAAEADRFYAATGVWLRAPRLPLLPEGETVESLGLPDLATASATAAAPVLPAIGPDPGLPRQSNPPPPGTSYPRDAQGNILATPEGTLLPSGILVFAAAPPLNPPTRPGTVAPPPEAEVAAAPETAPEAAVAAVQPMAVAPETGPLLRPASVLARAAALAPVPPEAVPPAAVAADALPPVNPLAAAPTGTEAPLGGVAWDGLRPATRPESLVPEVVVQTDFAGPRPPLRPAGIAPEPPAVEEPAPLPAGQTPIVAPGPTDVTEALVAIVAAAPDPLRSATAQAVAVARRPDMRPRNFDRVVARAQDRIARAQPAATTGAGAGGVGTGALQPEEQAETEPEVASAAAAAPSGPIPGGVADAATLENAITLREINLIGVYGRPDDRRALVRLANGRYLRVSVGDNLDGGRVAAIGDDSLNYTRSGRTITLEIPNG